MRPPLGLWPVARVGGIVIPIPVNDFGLWKNTVFHAAFLQLSWCHAGAVAGVDGRENEYGRSQE